MADSRQSKIWAIRMPGGPVRVLKSQKRAISGEEAKRAYMESFRFRSSEVNNDPDLAWPLLEPLDETSVQNYARFMEISAVTGKPRGLIEV